LSCRHIHRRAFAVLLLVVTVAAAGERGAALRRLRGTLDEAQASLDSGQLEQAAALFRRARDESSTLGPVNLPLARATDGLADVYRRTGRLREAARMYRQSVGLWESLLGERQPRLATTLHNLGAVQLALERPDLAELSLQRALEIWEATLGPESEPALNTERLWQRSRRNPGHDDPHSATGQLDG
jgi:tetratricopeptide (TPR) repeat protein